jgi:FemAB-related protein (PEP-CTERM system-associated)
MNAITAMDGRTEVDAAAGAATIRVLAESDRRAWDDFVLGAPGGSFFHLSGWRRIIEDVCGHRTHFLYAVRGSEITGVLPLAEIKSRLFGHSLVSTPFCVYGGVVAASDDDRTALENRACLLAQSLRVDYLELRNRQKSVGDWPTKNLYVTFRKRISANDDENLKAIPRKQRAMVRKGIDAGLKSHVGRDVSTFFSMYSESVRNLGTPVLSKRFFATLLSEFGDKVDILTVSLDGAPVSSVMTFYFRDEVLPYYGGGTNAARDLKANDFMYWELMRQATARGASWFDFGRSKEGTGSYSFKKNWGFEPETLAYQYHLVRSRTVPDLSPLNPKYRLMIATWRRLPLRLTHVIGPMLARYLG